MNHAETLDFYPQNGEEGCYTTCVAFIGSNLCEATVKPSDVDDVIGRQPQESVDMYRACLWMLRQGLVVSVHQSEMVTSVIKPYLDDRIDITEYIDSLFPWNGEDTPELRESLREWMEDITKPSYKACLPELQNFARQNKYLELESPVPSPHLLESAVNAGKFVLTTQSSRNNEGYTHAVTVFKPRASSDAMILIPDEEEYGGTVIRPLDSSDIDDIDYKEEFTIVSRS